MADGRAKNGGKRAGAGRKARDVEQMLSALLDKCTANGEEEEIIRKLVEDSSHPSFKIRHESRKLLLAYRHGKPVDRVEVSGEGGGPIPITIIEPVKPDA